MVHYQQMTKDHIEHVIHIINGDSHSTEDQIDITHGLWDEGVTFSEEGLKAKEIEGELGLDLDYTAKTSLRHLEDAGLVEEYREPGVEIFAIATWMDDGIVNGSVDKAVDEGTEGLIDHMHDDDIPEEGDSAVADGARPTIRSVVAEQFDIVPDAVESFLRDTNDGLDRLNEAVEAIEDHDDVSTRDDYGKIIFVHRAYRYRLTREAVRLYRQ